jgi:hypothetical protein
VLCAILGLSSGFHVRTFSQSRGPSRLSMIMPVKPGSIVALVTPMTESNAIDYPKLENLLKWHISEGIRGFLLHNKQVIYV